MGSLKVKSQTINSVHQEIKLKSKVIETGTCNILTKDRYSSMRHQIKSISHLNLWNIDFWDIVNFNSQIRIDFNSHDLNLNSFYFNINWFLTLYNNQLAKEDTTHSQNVYCLNHLHIKLHMMATEKNIGHSR